MRTNAVVLATGAFQRPHRPPAADLPPDVLVIGAASYTSPDMLPAGDVLVVGSGQTGCQIADEVHRAGRHVTLACGKAAWAPRRVDGSDIVSWLVETPYLDQTVDDLPTSTARLAANFQTTGRDRGGDLNYRTLRDDGVTLTGRLLGACERDPLRGRSRRVGGVGRRPLCRHLQPVEPDRVDPRRVLPSFPCPTPLKAEPPDEISVRSGSRDLHIGVSPAYRDWVQFPEAFDDLGFPIQLDGASTVVPGLYFMGTHFLRKRKSSTLFGMAEDAEIIARRSQT